MSDALWLREVDVAGLIDLQAAIDAVESAFGRESLPPVHALHKTQATWGGGHTLHALGAVDEELDLAATKTWAHTAGGATPLLLMWSATSGNLLAVIEAFALGQLRTAAVSGVATRWLAPASATDLAVIGSGKQAHAQVAAVRAVRSVRRIRVFSPTEAHRERFAARLRARASGIAVEVTASVAQAVRDADVVTTVTRSRQPFLSADMVAPDVHVNAIGAVTPERCELAADLVGGAPTVYVDETRAARELATELVGAHLTPISEVVTGRTVRATGAPSLFKAMGAGLADLAIAAAVVTRARAQGIGRQLPQPQRSSARLWEEPK